MHYRLEFWAVSVCAKLTRSVHAKLAAKVCTTVTCSEEILITSLLGTGSYRWEDWVLNGLCEWIFILLRVSQFAFENHLLIFRHFIFIFSAFRCQGRFFFFYSLFWDTRVVCLHVSEIHLNSYLYCIFVFIYRKSSFLISCSLKNIDCSCIVFW